VKGLAGRTGAAAAWVLAGAGVAVQAGLAVLAAAEISTLGWPVVATFDTVNVTLVLAAAVSGLAACGYVAARAVAGSVALRGLIRTRRRPLPPIIQNEVAVLDLAGKVDAVAAGEAFAVTHGLARPRILVSTALAGELTAVEVMAVLAHEREHLRRRDPLRLLAARLLAAWAWYLPAARWLAGRVALRGELAADRASAARAGRKVLAGALLKLAGLPVCPVLAAAGATPGPHGSLEARVSQLERGRPPRLRPAPLRVLATAAGLIVLAAAGTCCAALSAFLPGGMV
jgi:Zn-dependent protease with chaperone function